MVTVAAPAPSPGRPRQRVVLLIGLCVLGAAAATITAFHGGNGGLRAPDAWSVASAIAVALYVFAGIYVGWGRPSRFGVYLTATGFFFAAGALTTSNDDVTHTIGRVTFAAYVVCLAYVFLCFPHDNLSGRFDRRLIGTFAVASALLWVLTLLLVDRLPAAGPLTDCSSSCAENAFQVASPPDALSSVLRWTVTVVTAVALAAVAGALIGKALSPAHLRRRLVVPVLFCGALLALNYSIYSLLREFGAETTDGFKVVGAVAALAFPIVLLVGQAHGRMYAATSLGRFVSQAEGTRVSAARVESQLRQALGDPRLWLALWDARQESYVDVSGVRVKLPAKTPEVAVTKITHGGVPLAALVHDPILDERGGVAKGLAATALMLLENTQLVDELRASRARMVASEQRERLRLERDLHDGAQQRLFAIQVKLNALRDSVADDELATGLNEIADDAAAAVDELRALAHGLYPTVLRERGLGDALRSIALTAPIPVEIVDSGVPRCPATVEEAVYFCTREAIQNVTKHAGPGVRVTVTLERRESDLELTVEDDGDGFDAANHSNGMGIVSMRDRIGAVGGDLDVASRPGAGTRVHAVVRGCWSDDEDPRPS
jgi:signal transduction histidine kinase